MKKLGLIVFSALVLIGCAGGNKDNGEFNLDSEITVVSREDGSGTRGAFVELLKIEEKDGSGNKKDRTTPEAIIANKTDVMMTNISSDKNAIGYLSLGSLNDSVKALKIDGVEPSVENIKNNTYKVARPFNVVFKEDADELTQDFMKYILSEEGQAVVEASGYIAIDTDYKYEKAEVSGKIVVAGSSSVSPVMEKLIEAYSALHSGISIEMQTTDSTAGVQAAIDGSAQIGMASRELKDEEKAKINATVIGIDGIVVVVNKENPLEGLSSDDVKAVYTGEKTTWAEVSK